MTGSTLTRLAPTQVALEFSITDRRARRGRRACLSPALEERAPPRLSQGQSAAQDLRADLRQRGPSRATPSTTSSRKSTPRPSASTTSSRSSARDGDARGKRRPSDAPQSDRRRAAGDRARPIQGHRRSTRPPGRGLATRTSSAASRRWRKERATLVPVDRAAQLGDVATIDYEGKIDGVPFEGGTADGQKAELDEGRFIPGFAAGIVGMKRR